MQVITVLRQALASALLASAFAGAALASGKPPVVEVRVENYHYVPSEIRVKVGTAVKWINDEKRVSHSILFRGPQGFESERFFPGETWQRVFDKPGRYEYSCGPHPEMRGVVVVTD